LVDWQDVLNLLFASLFPSLCNAQVAQVHPGDEINIANDSDLLRNVANLVTRGKDDPPTSKARKKEGNVKNVNLAAAQKLVFLK
jgi:hypothetical protein